MVYLPVSLRRELAPDRPSLASRGLKAAAGFLEVFAAAIRVSRALEARRPAADADLRTLGIRGKLPDIW